MSIIKANDVDDLTCIPISNDEIVSLFITRGRRSLFTVDAKGQLLEWQLTDLTPVSALDAQMTIKAAAIADSSDVTVFCSEQKVVTYLRASALDQLKTHREQLRFESSLAGAVQRLICWIFRKPRRLIVDDPNLPFAAAEAAFGIGNIDLACERSLSEILLACYSTIAASAKKIDWNQVSKGLSQYQRAELEKQKQELYLMREERLAKAAEESQRRREFREKVYRDHQEAVRQAERWEEQRRIDSRRRSDSFWQGVSRILTDNGSSSPGGSVNRTRQVRSYVRKDGTRVRAHKRC